MSKTKIEDYDAVVKTVNYYLDGCKTGNVDTVKKAFHKKCTMTGYINDELYMDTIDGFYDMIAKMGAPSSDYRARADVMSLEGTIAVVHVCFEDWHGLSFSDYHLLLKENDEWKIFAKSYQQL